MRPQSLVLTSLGDQVLDRDLCVYSGSVIDLFGRAAVGEQATRSTLTRMVVHGPLPVPARTTWRTRCTRQTRTGDRAPRARLLLRDSSASGRVFGYSGASGRRTISKSTNWPLLSGEGQFRRVALLSDVVVRSTCPRSGVGVSLCSA
ncbi:hypothetical protein GCM10010446_23630 [Streptomyces enissocaesilis]|uniref:Transcriptional repressor PaaX-like N-terminal domain-containing protein n=1 Tax=Streptomyces enissocaesilis TaxID=332589 RepID=A0ABN3X6W9_9ACTN